MTPLFKVRKTIVEPSPDGYMTMDEDGNIDQHSTPEKVVAAIRARDRAASRRGDSTATLIEWRNMPERFEPPQVQS